ncbi:response regulator [Leptolyngbya sp. FACHB-36]|uniref:response regulator n=1 Tax=Leptolyngbya sp. FACHB-36 TaxID=2692808 RepID=UPI0016804F38|nr:response regulator [Leptolyngbya sp. FACHB-36]MBD2021764.1 response regulator [Leptolyngbya sp. FACHB-36]
MFLKQFSRVLDSPLVLVLDSDPDSLFLMNEMVTLCGSVALTAQDGATALRWVDEYQPALIVTELVLPKVDGFAVVERIRSTNNSVPIVALTSLPAYLFYERAWRTGCNAYIEKPCPIEQLQTVIHRYLDRTLSPF